MDNPLRIGSDKKECIEYVKDEFYLCSDFKHLDDIRPEFDFHVFAVDRGTCIYMMDIRAGVLHQDSVDFVEHAIIETEKRLKTYKTNFDYIEVLRMGLNVRNVVVARYNPKNKVIAWQDLCNMKRLNESTLVRIWYKQSSYYVQTKIATNTVSQHLESDWDIDGIDEIGRSVRWKQKFDTGSVEFWE